MPSPAAHLLVFVITSFLAAAVHFWLLVRVTAEAWFPPNLDHVLSQTMGYAFLLQWPIAVAAFAMAVYLVGRSTRRRLTPHSPDSAMIGVAAGTLSVWPVYAIAQVGLSVAGTAPWPWLDAVVKLLSWGWLLAGLPAIVMLTGVRCISETLPKPPICAKCGHDLRASPRRCPACGQVAKGRALEM